MENKMKFKKEFLQDLAYGEHDKNKVSIICDKIVGESRWAIKYEIVFKINDKYYMSHYSIGATEYTYDQPYEYEPEEIECDEVIPIEKTIIEYVLKGE